MVRRLFKGVSLIILTCFVTLAYSQEKVTKYISKKDNYGDYQIVNGEVLTFKNNIWSSEGKGTVYKQMPKYSNVNEKFYVLDDCFYTDADQRTVCYEIWIDLSKFKTETGYEIPITYCGDSHNKGDLKVFYSLEKIRKNKLRLREKFDNCNKLVSAGSIYSRDTILKEMVIELDFDENINGNLIQLFFVHESYLDFYFLTFSALEKKALPPLFVNPLTYRVNYDPWFRFEQDSILKNQLELLCTQIKLRKDKVLLYFNFPGVTASYETANILYRSSNVHDQITINRMGDVQSFIEKRVLCDIIINKSSNEDYDSKIYDHPNTIVVNFTKRTEGRLKTN